ncbi:MAG: hypothetical protein AB1489_09955 [Acidobacteriota bacterium]
MDNYSLLTVNGDPDKHNGGKKWLVITALVLMVIGSIGVFIWFKWHNTGKQKQDRAVLEQKLYGSESIRDNILMYLAQPQFAGRIFEQQILGGAHLELLQLDEREVYFSLPASNQSDNKITSNFIIDEKRVEYAEKKDDQLVLGKYVLLQSEAKHSFFKTPVTNIKIDPESVLIFKFARGSYTLTMHEMIDFLLNKNIFGGKLLADTGQRINGKYVTIANHGVMVSRPKESSLQRFVKELATGIDANDPLAREKRIQRLLDFVSEEIEYNSIEALTQAELLKRPNEVLMSRKADCSNKAILLASLLEQIEEDYLFLYCPRHITLAVKQGQFPANNGHTFVWEGKTWLIAESTAPGFKIGVDRLAKGSIFQQVEFIQRPSQRDIIIDVATGKSLIFR